MTKVFTFQGKSFKVRHNETEWLINGIVKEITELEHYKPEDPLPPHPIIMDLGAHVGIASLYFRTLYPDATIYAIEMNPQTYECLVENTQGYNIKTYHTAISSVYVPRIIYKSEDENSDMSIFNGKMESDVKVPSITIDRFMEQEKIDHVDLLKMDVEGAEFEIFTTPAFGRVAEKINTIVGEGHYETDCMVPLLELRGYKAHLKPFKNFQKQFTIRCEDGNQYVKAIIDIPTIFYATR